MTKRTKNDRILRWLKRRENKYSKLFREFENNYYDGKADAFRDAYEWIKFEIEMKNRGRDAV